MINRAIRDEAAMNLDTISDNPYEGRRLVIGIMDSGTEIVQINGVSSRSEPNRNRVFCSQGGKVWTDAADPSQMKEHEMENIIYTAMDEMVEEPEGYYVVSNGRHTDTVLQGIMESRVEKARRPTLPIMLANTKQEEDHPNCTSRITGMCSLQGRYRFELAIHRKSIFSSECDQSYYRYADIEPGFGYYLSTYRDDAPPGVRLPPFTGDPLLVPLQGAIEDIADTYLKTMNEKNWVALAVKVINMRSGLSQVKIHNRREKVIIATAPEK